MPHETSAPPSGRQRTEALEGVILADTSSYERVAGRTIRERARELLARAGCREIAVVERWSPPWPPHPTSPRFAGGGVTLVVAGDIVFDRALLPELVARGGGARCARGWVLATTAEHAAALAQAHAFGAPLFAPEGAAREGLVHAAATEAERAAAARALLAGTRKATDGPMRRLFERRLALILTERLVDRPVTPNLVTAASLAVGLAGAAALAAPGYALHVLGALLVVLAKLGDSCDGSLARAKLLESNHGDRLDTAADIILIAAAFTAVGVSVVRENAAAAAWAVLLVGGVLLACVAHETFRKRAATGSLAWMREAVDRAAMVEWGYALLAFALADALELFVASGAIAAALFSLLYFAVGLRASGRLG